MVLIKSWTRSWLFWAGLVALALVLILWVPVWFGKGGLPQEGQTIADFTLPDSEGQPFQLSRAYEDHTLILVFYRGFG